MKLEVCILAAGLGSRMKSPNPKALQPLAGRPMLHHLLDAVSALNPHRIHVVVGKGADMVKDAFADRDVNWVLQTEQKGTGHAALQALTDIDEDSQVLILLGDAPLVTAATMVKLIEANVDLAVLSVDQPDPTGYGRLIIEDGQLLRIVEELDTTSEQKLIKEINTGVMAASATGLGRWLPLLTTENAQGEYLLPDVIKEANKEGSTVVAIKTDDASEVQGVNSYIQLAALERTHQRRLADQLMLEGTHLLDPDRIDIRGSLTVGSGVRIDVNCIFEGNVILGNNVQIGPNCVISDSTIGDGSVVKPNTVIDGAEIARDCSVGPFARIRPGTVMADEVAIGNFVETKKAQLGKGTKSSHLTYLGDAVIGEGVNIGAGTITCNYDGVNKFVTTIEDNVFVGSNSALVAPVTLGEGSTIAAGSTITKAVPSGLGIARGKQKNLESWKGPRDEPGSKKDH